MDGCPGHRGGFCSDTAVANPTGGSFPGHEQHPIFMAKKVKEGSNGPAEPRQRVVGSYPVPWKGELLLVCRKCQKKLNHDSDKNGISKLRKALKKLARHDENAPRLHVLQGPCLEMCPKGGVTVCTQSQLGRGECSILRSSADIDALYRQYRSSTLDHIQGESG
jgi:hypothetical protein